MSPFLQQLTLRKKYIVIVGMAIISLFMHLPHFSKDIIGIHSWRQTQTQTTIQSFYSEDFNILNPRKNDRGAGDGIFRMEFPLMQWLVAAVYKITGAHVFITRICMFIIGLFSCLGMYALLLALSRKQTLALIAAWAFCFSPSFYFYTINPLPDNLALCCGIWGLAYFFKWANNKHTAALFISGFFLCCAALCKLPFVVYYSVPGMYMLWLYWKKEYSFAKAFSFLMVVFSCIIFPLCWYAYVVPQWKGNGIVSGLLDNRESTSLLLEYLLFNVGSSLPELLINYGSVLFFLAGFYFTVRLKLYKHTAFPALFVLCICLSVYYFFEMNMIARTHDYYLFPFYPVLFILVGYGGYYLITSGNKLFLGLSVVALVIVPLTAHLRMRDRWNPEKPGFNKDLLIYKKELREAVPDTALCIAGNDESHYIYLYYIDKKGWCFENDTLAAEHMNRMIQAGASYLYSDSRKIDESPQLSIFIDHLVLQKGSVRVYKLK